MRRSYKPFGPEDMLHGLKCQKCGYEAWSTTGEPAYCRQCGGLMIDEDRMEEEVEQFEKEIRISGKVVLGV